MSALTLIPLGYMAAMLVSANLGSRHLWARTVAWLLSGLLALLLIGGGLLVLVLSVLPVQTRSEIAINLPVTGVILLGTGIGVALCLVPWVRQQVARLLPINVWNPVHMVGLQLYLVVLANGLFSFLAVDPLVAVTTSPPETLLDIVFTEVAFGIFALLGVGFLIRRGLPQTMSRLGLVRPQLFHLALALVVAQLFLIVSLVMNALSYVLTPDLDKRLNQVQEHLYQPKGSALVFFAVLSIMAGVGEEVLFRGALQPRFRIVPTTILFASGHVQYGISFALLDVFIGGFIFGWMRQRTNTTTTLISHATYDSLTTLLPFTLGALPGLAQGQVALLLLAFLALQVIALIVWWVQRVEKRQSPNINTHIHTGQVVRRHP
jgi:uncharacterized protein